MNLVSFTHHIVISFPSLYKCSSLCLKCCPPHSLNVCIIPYTSASRHAPHHVIMCISLPFTICSQQTANYVKRRAISTIITITYSFQCLAHSRSSIKKKQICWMDEWMRLQRSLKEWVGYQAFRKQVIQAAFSIANGSRYWIAFCQWSIDEHTPFLLHMTHNDEREHLQISSLQKE